MSAILRLSGVGLLLAMIAIALMALTNPMLNAMKNLAPATSAEIEMVSVWDAETDLMLQAVVVDPAYSHALAEHPDTAPRVWDCFKQKGQYIAFQVDPGRRYLRVCLIDMGTIGFQIVDIVGKKAMEKTAYIKDTIKSLRELFEYANRMGYAKFTKPIF